ncbi:DUF1343 domain-containing protein [Arcanobacterium haemolyticum]|nr:DUF1343 domain-containing protein [Arcanobacterium haemolyticum]
MIELGIDRLVADSTLIPGSRWGLVTNFTGVTSDLRLSSRALQGSPLVALLSPEHGLRGSAQAGESEGGGSDPLTGLPVVDTYRLDSAKLDQALIDLDIDALIVDLQDIGVRFYTYSSTMIDCMRAAARRGIPFVVLDRPNPLGGFAAGPGLSPGYESFVGRIDVPLCHGKTIGELARIAAALDRDSGVPTPDPVVVEMRGWHREMRWQDTGLHWVPPSPNMPTPATVFAYVGTALFEGTNVSEGRGTTKPFELVGAPWLDETYADSLNALNLPGTQFRSAWFSPTFSKWAATMIAGAQVYLDPASAHPLVTALHMLRHSAHHEFAWNTPSFEGKTKRPYFVDLLWGNSDLRLNLTHDFESLVDISSSQPANMRDKEWLLYPTSLEGTL